MSVVVLATRSAAPARGQSLAPGGSGPSPAWARARRGPIGSAHAGPAPLALEMRERVSVCIYHDHNSLTGHAPPIVGVREQAAVAL